MSLNSAELYEAYLRLPINEREDLLCKILRTSSTISVVIGGEGDRPSQLKFLSRHNATGVIGELIRRDRGNDES